MAKKKKGKSQPERKSPEPEGGPSERSRAFLEERFTPLKRKSEGPTGTRSVPPSEPPRRRRGDDEPGAASQPRGDASPATPGPDRRTLIEEYRKRQERKGSSPRSRGRASGEAPRAAPTPPPANNWIPIGPSVLRQGQGEVKPATSGRTPAIAVVAGGNRAYIGAANGGVWRTEDGGTNWVSQMDAFDLNPTQSASDSLAVGAVAVVPGATVNTDRVYVGSGEGPGGAYFGVGPIMSTDGGQNWTTETVSPGSPSLAGTAFYALAVDPADSNRVVAATRQGLFRREPDGAGGFHWDAEDAACARLAMGDQRRRRAHRRRDHVLCGVLVRAGLFVDRWRRLDAGRNRIPSRGPGPDHARRPARQSERGLCLHLGRATSFASTPPPEIGARSPASRPPAISSAPRAPTIWRSRWRPTTSIGFISVVRRYGPAATGRARSIAARSP